VILLGSVAGRDRHRNRPGHPERPERLEAVMAGLTRAEVAGLLVPLEGRPARREELTRVHTEGYLDLVASLSRQGGGDIDAETCASAGSWDTAVAAAGLGLAAIEALDAGTGAAAFLALRPPGHHATAEHGMGFCLINNVAVTATALADRGQRVMVLDWDVHHGNGTQDIFWDHPGVLYASTHQWPAYPGTGRPEETGGPTARGTTVNVPLPPGSTGDVALEALDRVIGPVAEAFGPDWLLVSAGYDAHRNDPLADLAWSTGDYDLLARAATAFVGSGRTIVFLEGGYDLAALAGGVAATIAGLADVTIETERPSSDGPGRDWVSRASRLRDQALAEGSESGP
jgi:acetoin utilization deacetylase AcuC-like enzyme